MGRRAENTSYELLPKNLINFASANYRESIDVDAIEPIGAHHLLLALSEICHENEFLKRRIKQLEKTKAVVSDMKGSPMQEAETICISRQDMLKTIKQYFEDHHGEEVYPSDISEKFGFSYLSVQSIVDELERKGIIKGC